MASWVRNLILCLFLASCGKLPLPGLGGPNVAANVQAGHTNNQTVGTTQNLVRPQARTIRQSSDKNQVQAETVEQVEVNQTPIWLIIAFAFALLLDSPLRWPGQIYGAFRRD